jgi:hypothetical protein
MQFVSLWLYAVSVMKFITGMLYFVRKFWCLMYVIENLCFDNFLIKIGFEFIIIRSLYQKNQNCSLDKDMVEAQIFKLQIYM